MINVVSPSAFRRFEFNQVASQVGISVVRSLPGQLDIPPVLLQNLQVERRLGDLLYDEVDAGVVAPEGVGGHTGEEGGVSPLGPLDADGR